MRSTRRNAHWLTASLESFVNETRKRPRISMPSPVSPAASRAISVSNRTSPGASQRARGCTTSGSRSSPLGVLNKPAALDADEWILIREHPASGAAILAGFPALAPYAEMVRAHHERIDGRGYPDGLTGAVIPYESKIIAVVDSYHAMTVARPYSRACSRMAALRELEACSGTQFEPHYVDAFVAMMTAATKKPHLRAARRYSFDQ